MLLLLMLLLLRYKSRVSLQDVFIKMIETKVCQHFAKLRTPFTCIVVGAMGSGKTEFVLRLLRCCKALLDFPPVRVIYSYEHYKSGLEKLFTVDSHHLGLRVIFITHDITHEINLRLEIYDKAKLRYKKIDQIQTYR